MIILDENFPQDQRERLSGYRIRVRQIGREIASSGTTDANLIATFHSLPSVTFFTQDQDFFDRRLCHPRYCLVWLDLHKDTLAFHLRRVLKQLAFRTWKLRAGSVVRAHSIGLDVWRFKEARLCRYAWLE